MRSEFLLFQVTLVGTSLNTAVFCTWVWVINVVTLGLRRTFVWQPSFGKGYDGSVDAATAAAAAAAAATVDSIGTGGAWREPSDPPVH
jgi:hypothetical protein